MAAARRAEQRHHGALGGQLEQRPLVADCARCRARGIVVDARLQDQCSLSGAGGHRLNRDRERDLRLSPEPPQPGGGEHYRVEVSLLELSKPGVDVAVQLLDPEVGARGEQLRAAPQARGPDPRPLGDVVERRAGPYPDIGGVLTRRHRGDRQPLRHLGRQVLGRVNPHVGSPFQQRPLDPPHESRLISRLAVG